MDDICREKNLLNPLESRLIQLLPNAQLNPGIIDGLLHQTARGMAGRCAIGASESDITSAGSVCERHQGIVGLESEGRANDLSIDDIKAKRGID